MERKASGDDSRLEGMVRITTTEAFAVRTLLPRFALFRERHPGIEVQFLTDYGALDPSRREADIAVRLTPEPAVVPRPPSPPRKSRPRTLEPTGLKPMPTRK